MKKILIVEDDRELNEGIAFHIKKTGYQPIQTYDLRTAGLMFREEKPDLILLDVCLPDGEGFQFCRQIKSKRDIPILFITARDLEEDTLKVKGEECSITPTEFKLLRTMIENRGQLMTYNVLLDRLWDSNGQFVDKHALAVNINRLRKKIEDEEHKYITNVYGMGYQWVK